METKGKLVVISGFSGVGKGTAVAALLEQYTGYKLSISATTRQPREGEEHGKHYFFISKDEFKEMIDNGKLLEYAQYVDNYYGTPLEFVEDTLNKGINVILEIEAQGALEVKEKVKEAMLLFILPPTGEELKRRLVGRGTETQEVIEKRLNRAVEETEYMSHYEYFVVNDEIDRCINKINKVVEGDTSVAASDEEVEAIRNDIITFVKGE